MSKEVCRVGGGNVHSEGKEIGEGSFSGPDLLMCVPSQPSAMQASVLEMGSRGRLNFSSWRGLQ